MVDLSNFQSASKEAALVLQDGSVYQGISFGSNKKSISGEIVFQTGKLQGKLQGD